MRPWTYWRDAYGRSPPHARPHQPEPWPTQPNPKACSAQTASRKITGSANVARLLRLAQPRVELPVPGIGSFVAVVLWEHGLPDLRRDEGRLLNRTVGPLGETGQERGALGRGGRRRAGGQQPQRSTENVGEELPPRRVKDAAPGKPELRRLYPGLLQRLKALAQGEGYPLEGGAQEVRASVSEPETRPGAAGVRVEVRRALSAQVRQEGQARGTRRH